MDDKNHCFLNWALRLCNKEESQRASHDRDCDRGDKHWFSLDKIRSPFFFFLFFFFLALTDIFFSRSAGRWKMKHPCMTENPPENIRSEVIQTTCSAGEWLTPTSASSSKCGAVKKEQSLFIQSSAKQNSTAPRGPDSKYSRPQEPRFAKRICAFLLFFPPFCFNSVTNSTWKYNYKVEARWQTTAIAVIEQKGAEPAGSWPLRPRGEGGRARDRTWWHLRGDSKFIYNHRPPLGQSADITRN